jgi:hypothetical protein
MSIFGSDTFFMIFIITLFFTILIIIMLLYQRSLKEIFYNRELHRAEMNKVRASFEHEIKELTDRLTSTEYRWKDIYNLQLAAQSGLEKKPVESKKARLSQFLSSMGIQEKDLRLDKKLVFVLTPFSQDEHETFDTIKNVCLRAGLKCLRGDEEFIERGYILSHILRYLVKARIVIANINGRNPNVLYELGIAHAIGKPTILIGKSLSETPFDVQSKRIILYQGLNELDMRLSDELTKTLVSV